MIRFNVTNCPVCGGLLKYYDKVKRIVKTKGGRRKKIKMKRFKCVYCRKTHRELPSSVMPYKQYEAEVIKGVRDGFITPDTFGFEDYPCEVTMNRWSREIHSSL